MTEANTQMNRPDGRFFYFRAKDAQTMHDMIFFINDITEKKGKKGKKPDIPSG